MEIEGKDSLFTKEKKGKEISLLTNKPFLKS